jgi:hypothetical protein
MRKDIPFSILDLAPILKDSTPLKLLEIPWILLVMLKSGGINATGWQNITI